MQKTMYTSMRLLALFIAINKGEMAFEELFDKWKSKYKPSEDTILELQTMGKRLYELDSEEIKKVPEEKYRSVIKYTLTPEIQKEEKEA